MYIVTKGYLEVYTFFEGNEFVIDRLKTGSIINYNLILIDDIMRVSIRSGNQGTWLATLTEEKLFEIARDNKAFERKVGIYLDNQLRHGRSIVLDYLPSSWGKSKKQMKLKNNRTLLKNIVFNKILEIKDKKTKPKLGDLLKLFKDDKELLIEKINFLYAKKENIDYKTNKFDSLHGYFDLMKKVQLVHKATIDEIDHKVNQLTSRRDYRESMPLEYFE